MNELFYFVSQDIKIGLIIIFFCCLFTVLAPLFDMWTAIEAVKARGGKPSSHPMKRTGVKIVDYIRLILFVMMVDILGLLCFRFYTIPYCVVVITAGIIAREGLSIKENYALKKSGAEEVLDIASKIVQCLTKEDAEKLITSIHNGSILKQKEAQNGKHK